MSFYSDSNIATADALTLLLHNQHALGAAVEEVTKWLSDNGIKSVADSEPSPWKRWTQMHKRLQMRLRDSGSFR